MIKAFISVINVKLILKALFEWKSHKFVKILRRLIQE